MKVFLDRIQDRRLNIDTLTGSGQFAAESSRFRDPQPNSPCNYWLLNRFLEPLHIQPKDVFYDIGCGYGRILCVLARRPLAQCVGIELSPEFAARAETNIRNVRGRISPVEVRVGDAAQADYDDATVFCLFNPFGRETMKSVLERIRQSITASPRRIRFIYTNPLQTEVFRTSGWLKKYAERRYAWTPLWAEYWENEPPAHP